MAGKAMFILLATIVVFGAVVITRAHVVAVNEAKLGWMSEQWLAQHRAAHP